MNSTFWNHLLIRFIISFAFWEAFSLPVKMLFFSKFYYMPAVKSIFVPIVDIYWLGPVFADFIQIFFTGVLYYLAKPSLPEKFAGGFLFGIVLAGVFAGLTIFILSFTTVFPTQMVWVWCLYEALLSVSVAVIYSTEIT